MEKVKADITDKVGIEHFKAGQNILAAKDDELNDRINHNLEKIINLEESNVIQQQKAKYVDTLNERLTMEIEAKQQSEVTPVVKFLTDRLGGKEAWRPTHFS